MNKSSSVLQAKKTTSLMPAQHVLQRKCSCGNHTPGGGECAECAKKNLQGKLTIGASNDPLEQEADKIAEQVMSIPSTTAIKATPLRIQRFTGQTDEGLDNVPTSVGHVLADSGRPLEPALQHDMGQRFGHDFSQVRVHTGSAAEQSARDVNAHAYTVGNQIVFGAGKFAPESQDGQRLLAHELTHVVQQSGTEGHDVYHGAVSNVPAMQQKNAKLQRQTNASDSSDGRSGCVIGSGIPNSSCSAYRANSWWLPAAYVQNATCACTETPNSPTAKCVRKFLQDRLAATPAAIKTLAASLKALEVFNYTTYQASIQVFLTPRIYQDHVDAYANCCCPSGPAAYPAWIGVTSVPLPCVGVGAAIRYFGSCHGTPGAW